MPRGNESGPRSKRLEEEIHKQLLKPQEAGVLKTNLGSGHKRDFTFCQEEPKLHLGSVWDGHSVLRSLAQEVVRMKDPSRVIP